MSNELELESRGDLAELLRDFSAEVIPRDRQSIESAISLMDAGSEVFIAAPAAGTVDGQIAVATELKRAGLIPVPHIVARNIASLSALDGLLGRLTIDAGVDRVLLLAGDRERPVGELQSSLQLIESGLMPKFGIRRIAIAAHPEGHPRVTGAEIVNARASKLAAARREGLDVTFVSQFCFDSAPIIEFARELRSEGVDAPLRVGVAGPASRASLLKYAFMCGVGPSLRALKERHAAAHHLASGETPEELLRYIAHAHRAEPALGIRGIHFFTFGSLATSIEWARAHSHRHD